MQMTEVANSGRGVSLDEGLSRPGGVAVTVDDGYADFHEHVLPCLVRHSVPATLYLATSLVRGPDNPGAPTDGLTWSQLKEAVSTGLVTVGSHTHSHADLRAAGEREAAHELRRSRDLIEDHLGVACRHFAYPWSYCSADADRAARAMFDSAALTWRTNRGGVDDPYLLGRTPVLRSDSKMFFASKLDGKLDAEASAYKLLRRGPWRSA